MSISHYIDLKLRAPYNKGNIKQILQRGTKNGFCYFDHSLGERYTNAPVLDDEGAANKVLKAFKEKAEDGPCVFTKIEQENFGYLCFRETEDGYLEFSFGGFSSPQKKSFKDSHTHIDFSFYIKLCLDLCQDFAIIESKTESI